MRKSRRIVFRSLAALIVLAALSYSPTPVGACPPFERYEHFYDHWINPTEIGYWDRDCYCGTTSGGSTAGLWRMDEFIDCDTLDVYQTVYYGRCNPGDSWTMMSGPTDYPNWC